MERDDAKRGLILDGCAHAEQARYFDQLLASRKLPKPVVINLRVPDDEIVDRLAARGRPDDQPDIVRKRLRVYTRYEPLWITTAPAISKISGQYGYARRSLPAGSPRARQVTHYFGLAGYCNPIVV